MKTPLLLKKHSKVSIYMLSKNENSIRKVGTGIITKRKTRSTRSARKSQFNGWDITINPIKPVTKMNVCKILHSSSLPSNIKEKICSYTTSNLLKSMQKEFTIDYLLPLNTNNTIFGGYVKNTGSVIITEESMYKNIKDKEIVNISKYLPLPLYRGLGIL